MTKLKVLLAVLAPGYPASVAHLCGADGPTDADEATSPGRSGLSYDGKKDVYIYAWETPRSWKGTCRTLVLTLTDGTTQSAEFMFK